MLTPLPSTFARQCFTDSQGVTISYADIGSGPAIVWLHGSGPGADAWSNYQYNVPALLAAGYRCLLPDLPGYGASSKREDIEYHLNMFARCISEWLAFLDVGQVVFVGNSLGGAISLRVALDKPSLVDGLLLMAPGGLETKKRYFSMPAMALMRDAIERGDISTAEDMTLLLDNFCYKKGLTSKALSEYRLRNYLCQPDALMQSMQVPPMLNELAELSMPVMVFWGSDDKFMPLNGVHTMLENAPNIECFIKNNCGHWFMWEYPTLFNDQCLAYLKSIKF